MVICIVFCIDSVAGIMPIITCPGCNSTNTRFCHEKGFVENTRFCRKTGFIANTRLFGFVWCRLLRRHLGFDSDFAQISGLKIGGWQHWCLPKVSHIVWRKDYICRVQARHSPANFNSFGGVRLILSYFYTACENTQLSFLFLNTLQTGQELFKNAEEPGS